MKRLFVILFAGLAAAVSLGVESESSRKRDLYQRRGSDHL